MFTIGGEAANINAADNGTTNQDGFGNMMPMFKASDGTNRHLPKAGSIVSVEYASGTSSPRMAAAMRLAGHNTSARVIGVVLEVPHHGVGGKLKLKAIDGREMSIPVEKLIKCTLTHAVTAESRRLMQDYFEWYERDRILQAEMEAIAEFREELRLRSIGSFDAFLRMAQSGLSAEQFCRELDDKLDDIMPEAAAEHYQAAVHDSAVELIRTVEVKRFYDGPLVTEDKAGKPVLVANAEETEAGTALLETCRRTLPTSCPLYECLVMGAKDTLTYVGMYHMRELLKDERLTSALATDIAEDFAR